MLGRFNTALFRVPVPVLLVFLRGWWYDVHNIIAFCGLVGVLLPYRVYFAMQITCVFGLVPVFALYRLVYGY
jgi:hypothetical protein